MVQIHKLSIVLTDHEIAPPTYLYLALKNFYFDWTKASHLECICDSLETLNTLSQGRDHPD